MSKRLRVLYSLLGVGAISLVFASIVQKSWPPTIPVPEPGLPAVLVDAKELADRSKFVHVRDVSRMDFRILLLPAEDVPTSIANRTPQPGCAGLYVLNSKGERRRVAAGSRDEDRLRRALSSALQRMGQPRPEPGTAEFSALQHAQVAAAMFRSLDRANKHR
jgi:hypothetical protein